jgi:hypothetical protein
MPNLTSRLRLRSAAIGLALMLNAACASAADLRALVLGQSGAGAEYAFGDAYHVAQVLRSGQSGRVDMLRDASEDAVRAAVDKLAGSPTAVIYYAGQLRDDGQALQLADGTLPLSEVLHDLRAGGTQQLILLAENCAGPEIGAADAGLDKLAPESGLAVALVASAGPGAICPARDARLTDRLRARAQSAQASSTPVMLQQILEGLWTRGEVPSLQLFSTPRAAEKPANVSPVGRDVVTLAPVTAQAVSPVRTLQPSPEGQQVGADTVEIFAAAARAPLVALPRAPGLPEPSIIVGVIDGAANDPGVDIAYDDLQGRTRIRQEDPDRFAALVGSGAFDPPADQTARAIQGELSRMGCYNGAIDGLWGSGSRGALQRYFNERPDVKAASLDPVAAVFRQIIAVADVSCPAPRVTRTAAPRASAPRPSTPAPAPKPRPAPEPQRKIQSGTSLGVFR